MPGSFDGTEPVRKRAPAIERMVREVARVVDDRRVLEAMSAVPRERFVPEEMRAYAYEDAALPIGEGQTISQPLIVGMMTQALELEGGERVLDVGTGSGYQAAVLSRLAREVVTVEVIDFLRETAEETLRGLGITNVRCLPADDRLGAPDLAPFEGIVVAAAAPSVPAALVEQLTEGGRLVVPVGTRDEQELLVVTRRGDHLYERRLGGCRFVPLVGPGGFESATA